MAGFMIHLVEVPLFMHLLFQVQWYQLGWYLCTCMQSFQEIFFCNSQIITPKLTSPIL